uniref:Uncharacterized protein n=1 Tax=Sphaerodactylus townsendi TaxID=933632 RepID=A0ACB8F1F1_9SAUR
MKCFWSESDGPSEPQKPTKTPAEQVLAVASRGRDILKIVEDLVVSPEPLNMVILIYLFLVVVLLLSSGYIGLRYDVQLEEQLMLIVAWPEVDSLAAKETSRPPRGKEQLSLCIVGKGQNLPILELAAASLLELFKSFLLFVEEIFVGSAWNSFLRFPTGKPTSNRWQANCLPKAIRYPATNPFGKATLPNMAKDTHKRLEE